MKHSKTTKKRLLAAALAVMLALTGSLADNDTTAHAADRSYYAADKRNMYDLENTVVTVKPGDAINISYREGRNYFTDFYNWTSSNENVAVLQVKYSWTDTPSLSADPMDLEYVRGLAAIQSYDIIALNPGTTTITAAYKDDPSDAYSFTLKVKAPKKTAKQKKCKNHKWVTTKKATCMRPGVQTCKKCKLQKTVPLVNHKYKTKTVTETKYPAYVAPACEGCNTVFDPRDYGTFEYGTSDWNKNMFTEESYNAAFDAAESALWEHELECEGYKEFWAGSEDHYSGNWFAAQLYDYDHPYKETRKETKCKYCGLYKEWIEKVFTGE